MATSVASPVPFPTLSAQTPDEGALEEEVLLRSTADLTLNVETNRASNSVCEESLKDQ